ncbi:PLP-dependent transferase [Vararia minispora EC-137]|uniref:PLP-dependent transferase n=1 Tax=Vararia minispora EC-137 TaxID=1314806 RepID=A0ACB8QBB8_9AGAM|nr:PLP-dependent transferase [Vararia minispora EC-137]
MSDFELPPLELQGTPPAFGHEMLKYFCFEEGYVNLNHGSYGSLPVPVFDYCTKVARSIEANPDKFVRIALPNVLRGLRERMAPFVGAQPDEVVFVQNASHGINTVLRNLEWHPGDIIVSATTTYNAVERVIHYLHDITPHPSLSVAPLNFPNTRAQIINDFRKHIQILVADIAVRQKDVKDGSKLKIVAVIDSLVSNPGIYLPWKEMVKICRAEGVWTVVDAAHSLGQEVDITLNEVNPDFWVSNCHKWLYAKRGCAILYVPKRNQHLIKSPIPTPFSYHSPDDPEPSNFIEMFGWTGTIDHTPCLSVHAALDFRAWLGGEHKINDYCRSLVLAGAKRLAELLGTRVMDSSADGELTLNMANVALPLSPRVPNTPMNGTILMLKLLDEAKVGAPVFFHNGVWWTRVSAQLWNEMSDFEYLAEALKNACKEIEEDNAPDDGVSAKL